MRRLRRTDEVTQMTERTQMHDSDTDAAPVDLEESGRNVTEDTHVLDSGKELFDRTSADDEEERQDRLRRNTSDDPTVMSRDEVNPMHSDNWSGGRAEADAKKVARGEMPADQEGGRRYPPKSDHDLPPEATRPWAPSPDLPPEREHRDRDLREGEH